MVGRIFTIGALFTLARRAARESKMEEIRAQTTLAAREKRLAQEQLSREQNLQRMRGTSSAQMQMALADAGVSPMLTAGGMGGGIHASHIQRAAANQALADTKLPAGNLPGIGYGY